MWIATKHFLLNMTRLYHFWSYSSSCYPHKIIPVWKKAEVSQGPTPSYGAFGVDGSWRRDSHFLCVLADGATDRFPMLQGMASYPCTYGQH